MSFPSLLVILFWGAGRLASVRFLCQFCFNIVDTYDINRSISMTRVTLWVTKKNNPVVVLACICSAVSPLRSCMPFMHLFYVT
ncbi:hypothetical protein BDV40DRAFT_22577 [Aspergillus tamarii]|uniref:Secreted protein n=1 Tax=Aspergillus tamarii TaxID=41984 RepID=A0A5N6UI89_ASPTM|nr:hypothetical protein BDV40DRAFT_22577 [Aspergillus tamarii]